MKIIVLAAGEGKRMWPITKDKCLIPFLGKSLLFHNLKKLKKVLDPQEVIIVARSESKDEIQKIIQELEIPGTIAIQNETSGMADAILSAKDLIEGEILVVNGEDILESSLFQEVFDTAKKTQASVIFAGLKLNKYFPGGYLKFDGDKVVDIIEKPGEGREPSDMVKLVVDYFKDGKKLISYLEKASSNQDDVYEVALSNMLSNGMDVRLTKYHGVWIPLKYPWQILDILAYFLSTIEQIISSEAKIAKNAVIEGKVVIEDGVRVFEGASIKGPCYIGKNCIVGNNSMVRESDLEEGCVTGFNSDITRTYIGANSWFHTNYIGDSVIEGDFGMGSGAVLANLRLDDHTIRVMVSGEKVDSGRHKLGLMVGKGSRVGVNASVMPGVKVGSNSFVGPGLTLYHDVEDNKKVLVKQELEVTEHTPSLTSYDQFREKLEK